MAGEVTDVHTIGLDAYRQTSAAMSRGHLHPEVEFNLLLAGTAWYEIGARTIELRADRLTVFWGGCPHLMHTEGPVELIWATVPLGALTGQPATQSAVSALLAGGVLHGSPREAAHDRLLMSRWVGELSGGPRARHQVCLLEMLARLARLSATGCMDVRPRTVYSPAAERMLTVVARSYTEPLSVAEIAERADTHPTYAAQVFKDAFGMSVWHYVTELRVAHARTLLAGTSWGIDRIAHASGFQTRSSFYRAFRSGTGSTPTAYRRTRGQDVLHRPGTPSTPACDR
ncbi:helix-turn-helix domain-containing protein [Streptomyces sp. NPDC006624]|uniref:helix-turn-helix domain-containing protein n=1 Tax=Streptomyces sp. NPDC006624 TaxID=3154892 RepID=UPI0033A41A05